jgi:hypothetical protein
MINGAGKRGEEASLINEIIGDCTERSESEFRDQPRKVDPPATVLAPFNPGKWVQG